MSEVHELLAGGQRLEFAGAPARALRVYQTAEALADTPALKTEALRRVGDAHRALGGWAEALAAYERSLALADEAGLDGLAAEALNALGGMAVLRGDVERATTAFEAGLRRGPDRRVEGMLRQNLGMCAVRQGDHARALQLFVAALECFRDAGYRRGELMALNNLGALHVDVGDARDGLPYLREAGRIARELVHLDLLLLSVRNEAEALAKLGQLDEAERQIQEAIGHFSTAGNERRLAECLVVLGDIQRARHLPAHDPVAERCYRRAEELATAVGDDELVQRARAGLAAITPAASDAEPTSPRDGR